MRPTYDDQVIVSYMQSGLVFDFIDVEYGFDKIVDMLYLFKDGVSPTAAIEQTLGISVDQFDAHFKQYIAPQGFGFDRSIEIVVMVILGGMGNTTGVIAAAILLTVLGESLRQFGDFRMILYSLLIIVLMILRPQGLFTWQRPRRKA